MNAFTLQEMVTIQLYDPVGTVIESHRWTTLTIVDQEDQPIVSLDSAQGLEMNEDVGRGAIKVKFCSQFGNLSFLCLILLHQINNACLKF